MATMFGGVTDLHYTSFCGEDQRISTDGKIFSKYCNRSKTLRRVGGHQPPPPPLVPRWGYDFACMSEDQVRLPKLVKHDLGIFLKQQVFPLFFLAAVIDIN